MNDETQNNSNLEQLPASLLNNFSQHSLQKYLEKPTRVNNQVPIMHSPGEISQVASLYDSRIFDEPSQGGEPNIEFHIHAFLNP